MSKRFTGNIITDTPQIPQNNYQNTPASGVWGIYEVADLVERGLWPTLGVLDPSAFVENIFSTHLYVGNGSSQTITNGIDLANNGGVVMFKSRTSSEDWHTYDTERGVNQRIALNQTTANFNGSSTYGLTAFNSNGFSVGSTGAVNNSGSDLSAFTFAKVPKFFDIVTYTGNGSPRTIAHNLGSTPGCIIVKNLSTSSTDWAVYHRGIGNSKYLKTNSTDSQIDASGTGSAAKWNTTNPTSSVFSVGTDNYETNLNGSNYVAYLFAHHDGDGTFGSSGDQDIIKCGSYTGNGGTQEIDLGFEPQWLVIKRYNGTAEGWVVMDTMRGFQAAGATHDDRPLFWNSSTSESSINNLAGPTPSGFYLERGDGAVNASGAGYVYIAIRRGPMAVPTVGTDVFKVDTGGNASSSAPSFETGFVVDMGIDRTINSTGSTRIGSRLMGQKVLFTNNRNAEGTSTEHNWDFMDGFYDDPASSNTNFVGWAWKRAPSFFDVITWKVDGTGDQTIDHNLGVVPEMVWTKNRDDSGSGSGDWWVAHKDLTGWDSSSQNDRHTLKLNSFAGSAQQGYHRDFSSTSIRLLSNASGGYVTGHDCIGYLFASLDGISKVGSFTGNGSSQTIDCGFTTGARYILIKRTDSSFGPWAVYDTVRGIATGVDAYITLEQTSAQLTYDDIDSDNSGFIVNGPSVSGSSGLMNISNAHYIFYAIA